MDKVIITKNGGNGYNGDERGLIELNGRKCRNFLMNTFLRTSKSRFCENFSGFSLRFFSCEFFSTRKRDDENLKLFRF